MEIDHGTYIRTIGVRIVCHGCARVVELGGERKFADHPITPYAQYEKDLNELWLEWEKGSDRRGSDACRIDFPA